MEPNHQRWGCLMIVFFALVWTWDPVMGQLSGVIRLGRLNVDPRKMTLSGFSSGGTFAQQLQISYSSLFSGIAVFSHTYYRCGPGNGIQADYDRVCTTLGNVSNSELYDTDLVLQDIQSYYEQGLIDNPRNIRNKKLYVFAGTRNQLFTVDMSLRIMNVYEPLIQNPEHVKTRVMEASLLLPTVNFGVPCPERAAESFFLGSCGISGAYEALQFLLGNGVRKPNAYRPPRLQPLIAFDQREFLYGASPDRYDMDQIGYLYVPTNCYVNSCLFHFYFHGCLSGREFNGTGHIQNSGYLEVAELNNIIMVFPQAISSIENTIGCWDTYGFTGPLYATQRGGQVTAVRNMMARILGEEEGFTLAGPTGPETITAPERVTFSPIDAFLSSNSLGTGSTAPQSQFRPIIPALSPSLTAYIPAEQKLNPQYPTYPPRSYSFRQDSSGNLFSFSTSLNQQFPNFKK